MVLLDALVAAKIQRRLKLSPRAREQCEALIEDWFDEWFDGLIEKEDIIDALKRHGLTDSEAGSLWEEMKSRILEDEPD